ncbi:MAG: NAD(P)/FAD-dependent oxidoreductase [Chloroflexi bacterium]|nr:NAD(P)/FAD-dependent oxidoreductase [Chloroflexota bacterium]
MIIGGGPAGLTAAYELTRHAQHTLVLEATAHLGGLARTETYRGYRFDIGGHRFYTRIPEVQHLWEELLGPDLIQVRRLSRIYYRGKFFDYPLSLGNALANLGLGESLAVVSSYLKARLSPRRREETLEEWLIHRFGPRLYRMFFKTYTEKVWGMPCHTIGADWAAQRIQDLTLAGAILSAFGGRSRAKTLIRTFQYPRLGPGMLWERMREAIVQNGSEILVNAPVTSLKHESGCVTQVEIVRQGAPCLIPCASVISSMPLGELVQCLDPPPPEEILTSARALRHRAFLLVGLILEGRDLFPDNWIYVHSPEVTVGRIQNFRNWSEALVPSAEHTSLGMEYFCDEGDALWRQPDEALIALATQELQQLRLADGSRVMDGVVIRQPRAYPIYDAGYRAHVARLRDYLAGFRNVQAIGRNGMHRYNNLDHAMLTGLLAARNVLGGHYDIWSVNAEAIYGEAPSK